MWSLILLCLCMMSLTQAQSSVVTNGASGTPCPQRKCLDGIADCVNGTVCKCLPPKTLDPTNGHFGCYRTNNVFGEVFNDPKVRNFNDEIANFPFPCRYLLTSITTNLRIQKQDVGYCKCDLHAFHLKSRGKFYVGGFDFACTINNNVLYEQIGFSSRIVGIANNGVYTYTEEGTPQYEPDGPWGPTPVNINGAGITVQSSYDAVNNQARFDIPECGWAITFVAYDTELRLQQTQIPGLSFAINCARHPVFHDHDKAIANAPVKFGGSTYASLGATPEEITNALIIRGFTSGVAQNQPGAPPQCAGIGAILNKCSAANRVITANGCFWITNEPRFSRCLDPTNNTEPVLDIYQKCTGVHCVRAPTCKSFVTDLKNTNCAGISDIPQLTNIVNGSFCAKY